MSTNRLFFVYLLASRPYGTLYVGVTSDLVTRVHQHRSGEFGGFTRRYGVHMLVWFEQHTDIVVAIGREKQIKRWRRDWKINLIEESNRFWSDLYPGLIANGWRPGG